MSVIDKQALPPRPDRDAQAMSECKYLESVESLGQDTQKGIQSVVVNSFRSVWIRRTRIVLTKGLCSWGIATPASVKTDAITLITETCGRRLAEFGT